MTRARRRPALGPALLLAAALALPPVAGRAAVEGSPHDLIGQGYDVSKGGGSQERCTVCHEAFRATAQGLAHQVPPSLRERYGADSLACFSCHDGITLVAREVDASLTAFHPGSHGHDLAGYRELLERDSVLPGLGEGRLECTTCHDPHDSTRRPFLRLPLNELCLHCHLQLAEDPEEGAAGAGGNHPLGRDPLLVARPEMPLRIADDFTVAWPAPYPPRQGKGTSGTHWDLGGHLLGGATGELVCATCHAVHGDEAAPPAATLLAREPVREVADEFCEGCHRGARGDGGRAGGAPDTGAAPNPGGTSAGRTYHPCDDDAANGDGRIVETRTPESWPLGGGAPARLLCTTCHRAHGAEPRSRLLRAPVAAPTFCEECHDAMPLEHHHPAGAVEGPCVNADTVGDGGGALVCSRCHRAHNAGLGAGDEREFTPLLRAGLSDIRLCTGCHPPDNPTCSADDDRRASHFLGDPGAADTYQNDDPPLRETRWPESGLESRYGRDESGAVTLICLSCHVFREGAVVSGDRDDARNLLARSGNRVEWSEGGESTYLCLGCHGVNPGTGDRTGGHTHPLMEADAARLGREVSPPASTTPSGRVNCDSCHAPHGAVTRGGYYILEEVDGKNDDPLEVHPKIDFTATCHLCHDPEKY